MGWPPKAFPRILLSASLVWLFSVIGTAAARPAQQNQDQQAQDQQNQKEKARNEKKSERELYKELSPQYRKWLDEDVIYIITPEERRAFLHLQTNEEREQFIEA